MFKVRAREVISRIKKFPPVPTENHIPQPKRGVVINVWWRKKVNRLFEFGGAEK